MPFQPCHWDTKAYGGGSEDADPVQPVARHPAVDHLQNQHVVIATPLDDVALRRHPLFEERRVVGIGSVKNVGIWQGDGRRDKAAGMKPEKREAYTAVF